jgi:hypothetical protein
MSSHRAYAPQWTLRGDGSLPRCHANVHPAMKLALVLMFRHRPMRHHSSAPNGFVALFCPLLAVTLLWVALMLPACFTLAKNFTATICTTCAGLCLVVSYAGAVVVAAIFFPAVALFCAASLAAHAAWFLGGVHKDAAHGNNVLSGVMHVACALVALSYFALPDTALETPDIAYSLLMWLPELINYFVYNLFQLLAALYLDNSTCWFLVGCKDE